MFVTTCLCAREAFDAALHLLPVLEWSNASLAILSLLCLNNA